MPKRKLTPKQKKGIARSTNCKPLAGLSEEQMTSSLGGVPVGIIPSHVDKWCLSIPFAGDDAE